MWAISHYFSVFILCWGVVSTTVDKVNINVGVCPWFYLRSGYQDQAKSTTILELVATCSIDDGAPGEYLTTSLDLDKCIENDQGTLGPRDSGIFSKTCNSCGLQVAGSMDDSYAHYSLRLNCYCVSDARGYTAAYINLNDVISVQEGMIGCPQWTGNVESTNGTDPWPKAIPSPVTKEVPVTVTSIATNTTTNISTDISTAISTDISTATSTLISTITGSCQSASPTTVTKKHKVTKTKTARITETMQVTNVVTMVVTEKPPPQISASLYTTVAAKLSTQ
ncbi:hypothetical protein GGS26DRAFT_601294 [Hypomontagnella submonticulosa]|nr:hypothetical protein GGS26DRAFT_601294 [Hypomontagnella submonticulosa]